MWEKKAFVFVCFYVQHGPFPHSNGLSGFGGPRLRLEPHASGTGYCNRPWPLLSAPGHATHYAPIVVNTPSVTRPLAQYRQAPNRCASIDFGSSSHQSGSDTRSSSTSTVVISSTPWLRLLAPALGAAPCCGGWRSAWSTAARAAVGRAGGAGTGQPSCRGRSRCVAIGEEGKAEMMVGLCVLYIPIDTIDRSIPLNESPPHPHHSTTHS